MDEHQYNELRDIGNIIAEDHLQHMHLCDLSAAYPCYGSEDEAMVRVVADKYGVEMNDHVWSAVTDGYQWRLSHEMMTQDGVRFVNLTPHLIRLQSPKSGKLMVIEDDPSGPARVASRPGKKIKEFSYVSMYRDTELLRVERLPPPKPGVIYIVSLLVAQHCGGREDVYYPGTGPRDECVRLSDGQVYAVTRLIRAPTQAPKKEKAALCPKGCESCGI